MIIVDNALKVARGGRSADPGRHGRGRVHGPGPHQPDHEQRSRACGWPRSTTASPSGRRACTATPDSMTSPGSIHRNGLDAAIVAGRPAVAEDPMLICRSPHIDVIVDVTGSVEFGAHVFMEAFANGKHVVMMNAEVDATIGPILQTYAKRAGVTLSACDGDEPGLQMNLVRWVAGLGLIPRVVCNVKGLQDPYRNPTTQQAWAERWEQNPAMVTSFADGSKISFEQTIVANATGFKVRERGMTRGLVYDGSIMDVAQLYDLDRAPRARRRRRLHRRPGRSEGVRARRAHRSEAAPLPEPVQDGRRPAVPVLGAIPPRPLRDPVLHRPRRRPGRQPGAAARRSCRRGVRGRQA